jgi:hypothetical protein
VEGDRLEVRVEGDVIVMSPLRAAAEPEGWAEWRGRFRGLPLVDDLIDEHRREVAADDRLS